MFGICGRGRVVRASWMMAVGLSAAGAAYPLDAIRQDPTSYSEAGPQLPAAAAAQAPQSAPRVAIIRTAVLPPASEEGATRGLVVVPKRDPRSGMVEVAIE